MKYSGDMVKALAAGASTLMMGSPCRQKLPAAAPPQSPSLRNAASMLLAWCTKPAAT